MYLEQFDTYLEDVALIHDLGHGIDPQLARPRLGRLDVVELLTPGVHLHRRVTGHPVGIEPGQLVAGTERSGHLPHDVDREMHILRASAHIPIMHWDWLFRHH